MSAELSQLGFDERFTSTVQTQITDGTSALFILSNGDQSAELKKAQPAEAFEIVDISLNAAQLLSLRAGFDG